MKKQKMVIHNEKYASKLRIWKTFGVVGIITLCVYIPLSPLFLREFGLNPKPLPAYLTALFILLIIAIYAGIIYLRHQKRLYFINISDEDKQHLVFRFYHIQLLMRKCTSYKIPFESFKKYEIKQVGKDKQLILYQRVEKNQLAKYPPIFLNALKDDEVKQVTDLLDQYC